MIMIQELVWAARRILRRPMSAVGIVTTLTLGIGVSVGMFSVLYGVVLKSLPYPHGDRVAVIHSQNLERDVARGSLTPIEALEGLAVTPGLERAAAYYWGGYTFLGDDRPRELSALFVTADYFSVFGTAAAMGRTLDAADVEGFRDVVVLNHGAWMELTGGDPDVVGRSLRFAEGDADVSYEVVGVMPPSFQHPVGRSVIFRPIAQPNLQANQGAWLYARFISALGRLAPDATPALVEQALDARLLAVNEAHGVLDRGWRAGVVTLLDDMVGDVRNTLFALFAVTLLVLLIACANTASLVSIRLDQRSAELAVRRVLGASGPRVTLDVAMELCLLVAAATGAGLLLAYGMIEFLKPLAADSLPRAGEIMLDGRVMAFAAIAAVISVFLSGAMPMWRAARVRPAEGLRGAGGREVRGSRLVAPLPVLGVGLSTIALVTALALTMSLVRLGGVDPGFRTEGITALQLWRGEVPQFVERVSGELLAIPGVRGVNAVSAAPLSAMGSFSTDVAVRGRDEIEPTQASLRRAMPELHRFLGIPMVRGRDISPLDTAGAPNVVVINETLARRVFGDADPVGEVLLLPLGDGPRIPFEIVGVSADTKNAGLRVPTEPEMMVAINQTPWAGVTLLVDSAVTPPGWIETLQQAVWAVDPQQALSRSYFLEDDLAAQLAEARFFAAATGWFAVFALLLGAAGVNAVVAAMQRRRTREIGLRLALGAAPAQAARLVVGNAARIMGIGLSLGLIVAVPAMGWLQGQLFGVSAATLWGLFTLTVVVLLAAGFAAAAWPAWRASRVAPMEALRYE